MKEKVWFLKYFLYISKVFRDLSGFFFVLLIAFETNRPSWDS